MVDVLQAGRYSSNVKQAAFQQTMVPRALCSEMLRRPYNPCLGRTPPQLADSGFDRLCALIQTLPRELFDQIQDNVFDTALCPGYAFPHRETGSGTFEWKGTKYNTPQPQLSCNCAYGRLYERYTRLVLQRKPLHCRSWTSRP